MQFFLNKLIFVYKLITALKHRKISQIAMSNICPASCNELQVVEYPGRVENIEKMLETLGGRQKISQCFSEKRKLDLHYHPENPFNKGITSEIKTHYGLLLAITVRHYKKKNRPPEYSFRVLGHCNTMYSFSSICDFQYLPLVREPSTKKLFNAINVLKPQSICDAAYFSQRSAPLLTLPTVFARVSSVAPTYAGIFRFEGNEDEMHPVLETTPKTVLDTIDMVAFSMVDALPTQPDPQVLKRTKAKYGSDEQFQRVKKLFEECPIWTRIALLYESKVTNDKLKNIVPALAFFYTSGPWRSMYVRYGYDPRKDFKSRYYQTFDFRIRCRTGVSEFVSVRADVIRKQQNKSEDSKIDNWAQDINYPYFSENKLPRARQCIMRYCDLHVPRIQEMLEKIPTPLPGATCNEKAGWLPPGFDSQTRLIIGHSFKDLLSIHNAEGKQPDQTEENVEDDDEDDEQTDEENIEEILQDTSEDMDIDYSI